LPPLFATIVVERRYPHQSRNLLAIELAQFRQVSHQGGRSDEANPRYTVKALGGFSPFGIGGNGLANLLF
jgi:hypothetical protein